MIEQIKERATQLDKRLQLGIGIALGLIILLLLLWAVRGGERPLEPLRSQSDADLILVNNPAEFVAFPDLNADPEAYLDQMIRVSGDYTPQQPPTCLPYSGPTIQWALISEGLQLDAQGFEAILRRVPTGTILTVEGIWRRYHGPFGCGKEPPDNDAWYLEVTQIIEPNPLFGGENAGLNTILGPGRTPTPQVVSAGEDGEPRPTATAVPETTTVATVSTIGQSTNTPTITPTRTPIPTSNATATATSVPGTPTITRTPTMTPTPTTTGTATTTPTITPTLPPGQVPPTLPPPDPYTGPPDPPGYP